MLKRIGASAICLIGFLAVVWVSLPGPVATVLIKLNNASAGLSAKEVRTKIGDIHYLEGGAGETILMVHGIYGRKEHWVELARRFVEDYNVIAIDLPGFGDNAALPDVSYLLGTQKQNLLAVLDAIGVEKAHFAANSMGAYIATLAIADRPDIAASVAFIGSPLGVPTAILSDMDSARTLGQTPLVVETTTDFYARNAWLAPVMPYVPGPILKTWMQAEVAQADHNARVWDVVHHQSSVPSVLELAPNMKMPSLVVWCRPDRIFHVSGAAALHDILPHSRVAILDDCGHVPMLDQPQQVAEIYAGFLDEN